MASSGLEVSLPDSVTAKFTHNAYGVAGGSVTTSPMSRITLSNALVYEFELKKSW